MGGTATSFRKEVLVVYLSPRNKNYQPLNPSYEKNPRNQRQKNSQPRNPARREGRLLPNPPSQLLALSKAHLRHRRLPNWSPPQAAVLTRDNFPRARADGTTCDTSKTTLTQKIPLLFLPIKYHSVIASLTKYLHKVLSGDDHKRGEGSFSGCESHTTL